MSYEDAISRAELATSFVQHPYWDIYSKILSGTIQSETEEMLAKDDHIAVNRASVAICRKLLQAPFFDIEQGKAVQMEYQRAVSRGRAHDTRSQRHEVQ